MRFLLIVSFIFMSLTAQAQSQRSICENAHYAAGYTKLHQYTVTVTWAKISDTALEQLENLIYGNFKTPITEKDSEDKTTTTYLLKERSDIDGTTYEIILEALKDIPANVACTYDL